MITYCHVTAESEAGRTRAPLADCPLQANFRSPAKDRTGVVGIVAVTTDKRTFVDNSDLSPSDCGFL